MVFIQIVKLLRLKTLIGVGINWSAPMLMEYVMSLISRKAWRTKIFFQCNKKNNKLTHFSYIFLFGPDLFVVQFYSNSILNRWIWLHIHTFRQQIYQFSNLKYKWFILISCVLSVKSYYFGGHTNSSKYAIFGHRGLLKKSV